jgi:hypothetical protein
MPKYLLYAEDGDNPRKIRLAGPIAAGETIPLGRGRSYRVIDVLPIMDADAPYVGALRIEPHDGAGHGKTHGKPKGDAPDFCPTCKPWRMIRATGSAANAPGPAPGGEVLMRPENTLPALFELNAYARMIAMARDLPKPQDDDQPKPMRPVWLELVVDNDRRAA